MNSRSSFAGADGVWTSSPYCFHGKFWAVFTLLTWQRLPLKLPLLTASISSFPELMSSNCSPERGWHWSCRFLCCYSQDWFKYGWCLLSALLLLWPWDCILIQSMAAMAAAALPTTKVATMNLPRLLCYLNWPVLRWSRTQSPAIVVSWLKLW